MFDAESPEVRKEADPSAFRAEHSSDPLLPVLMVLHQPHSTTGRIGVELCEFGYPLDVRRPRLGDALPPDLEGYAGAIIFGGPMSANGTEECVRIETEWIAVPLREKKPFLGICLDAQMLAKHLGAKVWRHRDCVEIGYYPVRWQGLLAGAGAPERFYQWHGEGFDLPHGSLQLAASDGPFPNQAFSHGGTAVGLQFHPEITYTMVNRWTARNNPRMSMLGAHDRPSQLSDHFTYAPAVHRWLSKFLLAWLRDRRSGA